MHQESEAGMKFENIRIIWISLGLSISRFEGVRLFIHTFLLVILIHKMVVVYDFLSDCINFSELIAIIIYLLVMILR